MTKSRPSLKRALTTVALMAAYNVTPGDCFGSVATVAEKPSGTRRLFTVDGNLGLKQSEQFFNPLMSINTPSSSESLSNMPSWLRLQKAHLVNENREQLRDAMLKSFFTETEVLKLTYAIEEAGNGDRNKIAGAAEFCLIMVETMEMGLNALIAAAFHYCQCVDARERSLLPRPELQSDLSPWDVRQHHGIESFGEHAVLIERDAARLKRLEMVASKVVHNSNNSHRVTPDSEAANNLKNLFLTEAKDWRALAIRGAACLYRLRGILKANTDRRVTKESGRVCREALRIYAPLASRLGMHRLKNELETAAFRILYRRQYETVTSLLHQTRDSQNLHMARFAHYNSEKVDIGASMEQILAEAQAEMTALLENDPEFSFNVEDFTVTARVKESYSTWKKMLSNKFDHILQVPDALALRIVLNAKKDFEDESDEVTRARERALCYYAQKLCTERWAPHTDDPRFKDYIAKPKANGYQSLHYTASNDWQGEEWSMEIQVRSGDMHKVAEFGVASHWDYKARGKPATISNGNQREESKEEMPITINEHFGKAAIQKSDAYLRSLQEWHWKEHGGAFEKDAGPSSAEPIVLSDEADSQLRAERIRARTQHLAPYIEALTAAQSDLAREKVFVFLSKSEDEDASKEGTVVALPAGAVVLDAVRGCKLPAAFEHQIVHNGAPASLTSRLNNGDVLSIPSVTACVTTSM